MFLRLACLTHMIRCSLEIPHSQLFRHKISLPNSWCELPVSTVDLEKFVSDTELDLHCETLEEWAKKIETAVDGVLRKDHLASPEVAIVKKLPNRFKGRCKPVCVKQFPLAGPVRRAWQGHYNPDFETQSSIFKRFVRQARRITSIKHRVAKLTKFDVIWHRAIVDILQEWQTICYTVLEGEPFWCWMSQIPELCPIPDHIPSFDWLHLLEQFVQHHVQQLAAREKEYQKNMLKWQHKVDCKDKGKKQAFAVAKGVANPPFNRIQTTASSKGILAATQDATIFEVFVHDAANFTRFMPIEANEYKCHVIGLTAESVVIRVPNDFDNTAEEVDLVQQATQTELQIIFTKLWEYWNQFWKRDEGSETYVAEHDDYLHSLLSNLPHIPPFPQFCENDIKLWKEAIRRTKQTSTPGCDGVTFEELKLLPDGFIQALADVLSNLDHFPEDLMCAKTVPLPKVSGIPKSSDSRPITILPTCYRLWARVTCAPMLQYLSNLLPPEITGMLPRRGVISARYDFRTLLEMARHDNNELTGVTLDLRKCFNLIHRDKAKQLLLAWGLPPITIEKWYRSLQLVKRFGKSRDSAATQLHPLQDALKGIRGQSLSCWLWPPLGRQCCVSSINPSEHQHTLITGRFGRKFSKLILHHFNTRSNLLNGWGLKLIGGKPGDGAHPNSKLNSWTKYCNHLQALSLKHHQMHGTLAHLCPIEDSQN